MRGRLKCLVSFSQISVALLANLNIRGVGAWKVWEAGAAWEVGLLGWLSHKVVALQGQLTARCLEGLGGLVGLGPILFI